jgi:energy-coupling factor transporter ATP-binding protein EcfA2
MTEIIFKNKKIESADDFIKIFNNNKNNVLVITGKNGCGKTRFFNYLKDFLKEQTEKFYPILLQFSAENLKAQSKQFECFNNESLELKFKNFLNNDINDKIDDQREKLQKIKDFFNKSSELDKLKDYLIKNKVNYDHRIEEHNNDANIEKANFYLLKIMCKYIKKESPTRDKFMKYLFKVVPNDLFGPNEIFEFLKKNDKLNAFNKFIMENSQFYGFKYRISPKSMSQNDKSDEIQFVYDEDTCFIDDYEIKFVYVYYGSLYGKKTWMHAKTYNKIKHKLKENNLEISDDKNEKQEYSSINVNLRLISENEKNFSICVTNDPVNVHDLGLNDYEDKLVICENNYQTFKYNHLSSGERFIFFGLLWKFLSENKLKVPESDRIVYLLDEPDCHLEQSAIENFMNIIQNDLVKELDIKVLIITHNIMTVHFFNEKNVFSCELNRKNQFKIDNLSYSKSNEMLTNSMYLSFKKGNLKNPCLFDDLILEVYPHQSKAAIGDSMEAVFRVYFQNDKEKRLQFIKDTHFFGDKKAEDIQEDDVEFEETKNFNKIDLEKEYETKISENENKVFILWPRECNPCFDFLVVAHKQISFYQIKISTGIEAKLDATFFGKNKKENENEKAIAKSKKLKTTADDNGPSTSNCTPSTTTSTPSTAGKSSNNTVQNLPLFEKHYENIIKNQLKDKKYIAKYFFIHGNFETKYENYKQEYDYDSKLEKKKYEKSIIEDSENKPKLVQLYSTDYLGRNIFDSKFMQFYNQFEINIIEKFKKPELLKKFLDLLKVTESEIAAINYSRVEDINDIDSIPDQYIIVFQKFIVRRTRDFEFFILKNDKLLYFYATTKEYSRFKEDIIANNQFNLCVNQSLNLDKRYAKFFKKYRQFINNHQIFVISGFKGDDEEFMMTQEDGVKNISKNVIKMVNKKSEIKCSSGNCQKSNCKDNPNSTIKRKHKDIVDDDDDDDNDD